MIFCMCVTVRTAVSPPKKKTSAPPPLPRPALSPRTVLRQKPHCAGGSRGLHTMRQRPRWPETAPHARSHCWNVTDRTVSHALVEIGLGGCRAGVEGAEGGHVHARTCVRTHRDASGSERGPASTPTRGMRGIRTYLDKFCVRKVCRSLDVKISTCSISWKLTHLPAMTKSPEKDVTSRIFRESCH